MSAGKMSEFTHFVNSALTPERRSSSTVGPKQASTRCESELGNPDPARAQKLNNRLLHQQCDNQQWIVLPSRVLREQSSVHAVSGNRSTAFQEINSIKTKLGPARSRPKKSQSEFCYWRRCEPIATIRIPEHIDCSWVWHPLAAVSLAQGEAGRGSLGSSRIRTGIAQKY